MEIVFLGDVDARFVQQGAGCVPGVFLAAEGGHVDDEVFERVFILFLHLDLLLRLERYSIKQKHCMVESPDDCHTAAMDVVQNCLCIHNEILFEGYKLELA